MASNPEQGEILLTELQVRAATRVRGAGGREREKVWRGVGARWKPRGRRAPNPLSAETWGCRSGAASFGSRPLSRLEPWIATALITYYRDPVFACSPSQLSPGPLSG